MKSPISEMPLPPPLLKQLRKSAVRTKYLSFHREKIRSRWHQSRPFRTVVVDITDSLVVSGGGDSFRASSAPLVAAATATLLLPFLPWKMTKRKEIKTYN